MSSARTLILGIIISNFLLAAMFGIAHEQVLATQNFESIESSSLFLINYKYFFTGTVLLMFDFILLVTIYQFLISKKSRLYFFLILFISLSTVLIFDSIVFNLSLNYGSADFNRLLIGHILGKTMAALTFSTILYLYLNYIDTVRDRSTFIANQDRDIFSIINYRKNM